MTPKWQHNCTPKLPQNGNRIEPQMTHHRLLAFSTKQSSMNAQLRAMRERPDMEPVGVEPLFCRWLAWGDDEMLCRPCVDCGLYTGYFCDGDEFGLTGSRCLAADRIKGEEWAEGQRTPFCSNCEKKNERCHYCRGVLWCVPPPHRGGRSQ